MCRVTRMWRWHTFSYVFTNSVHTLSRILSRTYHWVTTSACRCPTLWLATWVSTLWLNNEFVTLFETKCVQSSRKRMYTVGHLQRCGTWRGNRACRCARKMRSFFVEEVRSHSTKNTLILYIHPWQRCSTDARDEWEYLLQKLEATSQRISSFCIYIHERVAPPMRETNGIILCRS